MGVLGLILLFIFYSWLVLSPIVWLYWHLRHGSRSSNRAIVGAVGIGTIFGITALLWPGFESALFFIPSSWSTRSGPEVWERESLRHSLAGGLSFFCTVGFLAILDKLKRLRVENQDLRRLLDEQKK